MSKWLAVLVAVVAVGTVGCGSDDDGDAGNGGPGGNQSGICADENSAEYQACADALVECILGGGPCTEKTNEYLSCDTEACLEEKGAIYVQCIEDECPDAAPCAMCK